MYLLTLSGSLYSCLDMYTWENGLTDKREVSQSILFSRKGHQSICSGKRVSFTSHGLAVLQEPSSE